MLVAEAALAAPTADEPLTSGVNHLVVSEVMTGGASASDEFVELYNPSPGLLSLDGLELVYVTASGATVTRKAIWGPGAFVPPGGHVLVANEAGIFGTVADATYANGLAATGGSMALRVVGASGAMDAVGWGTAVSTWLETAPAPAPPAGSSLERLPGGPAGSGQDSDHNLVDFVVRPAPDPQNSASPPVPDPSPTPERSPTESPSEPASESVAPSSSEPTTSLGPTESATATPTPMPTIAPSPTPTSTPAPITVAAARAAPDGAVVLVTGVTLTDSAFHDGGGYLVDATGGIAVLVEGGTFHRGVELLASGTVDDRYAQRTLRADVADLTVIGPGLAPGAIAAGTGAIGEAVEGQLVVVSGIIDGGPTELAAGLAYEIDDGSGPVRVLVGPATGIDTTAWEPGATLRLTGVVGQRDSSGTGTDGYRVQPRDPADIISVEPAATPQPTPEPTTSESATASPSPSPSPSAEGLSLVSIARARTAATGTRLRIRGVVTLPSGMVEAGSAVIADASGAILVRTNAASSRLLRGQLVELSGTRSTKSGMASLRMTAPALVLGTQPEPAAIRRATGAVGERDEATLVIVRGVVRDGPRRTSGGGLTLTVDDGSGPLRVFVAAGTGVSAHAIPAGAWVEVRGVVGQQTTGSAPNAGYRLWPRARADVTVLARPTAAGRTTKATSSAVRRTPPRATPGPVPEVILKRPNLGGALAKAATTNLGGSAASAPETDLPPVPVPLAACIGGLAGLMVLAWRHGTLRRAAAEVELRAARFRSGAADDSGDEEDESVTLAS
jgi:hypothetical protein